MSPRAALAPVVAASVLVTPQLARACAVCMSGREDDVQFAFILTTVFMSVLPLAVIGGAVWWLRRRLQEMERTQAERMAARMGSESVGSR